MAYTDDPHYQQAVTDLTQFTPEQLEAMSQGATEFMEENGYNMVADLLTRAIQDALEQKQ
jgi:hypothetical protein